MKHLKKFNESAFEEDNALEKIRELEDNQLSLEQQNNLLD